jgi:transcriptional regulator with PAS, ATPase and Fis domain
MLPPLRSRREDIAPLFAQFVREQTGGHMPAVEPKLVEALLLYDWPLNVRELVLLVRRLLAVNGHEPMLRRAMLPERIHRAASASVPKVRSPSPSPTARAPTTDEADFDRLIEALRENDGNVSKAVAALGISRARAYRLLDARPDFDVRTLRDSL